MNKVRKAIIPCAGLGTRFLPVTKNMAKEMLPIIDTPTIQLIVEEAIESGIEEILIITNTSKHDMEDYFDVNFELEERLKRSNKINEFELIHKIAYLTNVTFVHQKEPKGLGHAILCGKTFAAGEPVAVLLGDDVVKNKNGSPALKQLVNQFEKVNASILGVQTVAKDQVNKYGIIKPTNNISGRLVEVEDMVEKPSIEESPSCLAILGRYILTPEIFEELEKTKPGKGGEIQLTDAIKLLCDKQKVYAYDFEGERYDVGDRFGFVKATIDYALDREDLKEDVQNYIDKIALKK